MSWPQAVTRSTSTDQPRLVSAGGSRRHLFLDVATASAGLHGPTRAYTGLHGVGERVGKAAWADVRAVVIGQLVPVAPRVAGVVPQAPTPLARPAARGRDRAAHRLEVTGAEPAELHDRGFLVGQRDEQPAVLDADPRGAR